jgi:prevent-host-death family protein
MSAIAFKARCSKVMDDVQASREPVLITKRGKPVVKIVCAEPHPDDIFGFMSGQVKIVGDIEAPIDDWNALKRYPRHRKNSRSKSTP